MSLKFSNWWLKLEEYLRFMFFNSSVVKTIQEIVRNQNTRDMIIK